MANSPENESTLRWRSMTTSPLRGTSPLHMKSPSIQLLQAEKDTACLQLSQAKQALLVERSLADAKQEELREVFDHLHGQLVVEKEVNNRIVAEHEASNVFIKVEKETFMRRVREQEAELEAHKKHAASTEIHMKQKEFELARFLKQLEEAIQEKDKDSARLAATEAELSKVRNELLVHESESEETISQLKAECREASIKTDDVLKQLGMSETDLALLHTQNNVKDDEIAALTSAIKSMKLEAIEKEHSGDAAEALAEKRAGQLNTVEQALSAVESELAETKLLVSDLHNNNTSLERKCCMLEEEANKSEKYRAALEAATVKHKDAIAEAELKYTALQNDYDVFKNGVSRSNADTYHEQHRLEVLLDDSKLASQKAQGNIERLNNQLASQQSTAKQMMDTFNERIEREKERARTAAEEIEILKTTVSDLQILLHEKEANNTMNSSTAASLLEEAQESVASLRREVKVKSDKLALLEDELAITKRHSAEALASCRKLEEFQKRTEESEENAALLRQQLADLNATAGNDKLLLTSMNNSSEERAAAAETEAAALQHTVSEARASIETLTQALEASRAEVAQFKAQQGPLLNIEKEREGLAKMLETCKADFERKTAEAESLRAQLATERSERAMNEHEEENMRRQIGELVAKFDPMEAELQQVGRERDAALEHNVALNTSLGHEIAGREAAELDVERMRKLLEVSKNSTQRDYEASIAVLRKKISDMGEELESVSSARSELVRAVWNLLTELGIAKQQFTNVMMTPGLKKTLVKLKPCHEELQRILESISKSRQQAKWIVANFLTEVEKMHLGTSEWHFTPSTKKKSVTRTSSALREARSLKPSIRTLSKQRTFPVERSASPLCRPQQVPVGKPEMGPYSPQDQRVSMDSDMMETLLTPKRRAHIMGDL